MSTLTLSVMAGNSPGLVGQSHLGKMKVEETRERLRRVVNGWPRMARSPDSVCLLGGALQTNSTT